MAITLKLDEQLERAVRQLALARGETTSHVVREALAAYLVKTERPSAYDLGKDLFGCEPEGPNHPEDLALLASQRKQVVREIWAERDARRQAVAVPGAARRRR